ncbi:hypothetical protein AX17_003761 [Amanita inopinata Kibby_2008]|nr:hypothetical protein AX17_003761 [Amanita inopinata Kibby_2008]
MDPAFLTDKLTEYLYLFTRISERIQIAGPTYQQQIPDYEAAGKAWKADTKLPVKYTEAEVAEYFSKTDKACARMQESNLPVFDLYYIGIALGMAMQVLDNVIRVKHFSYADITNEANKRAMQRLSAEEASGPPLTGIPDNKLHKYLTKEQRSGNNAEEDLFDQDILYEDPNTGAHRICTVVDSGSSRLRGEYFEVIFDHAETTEILSGEEMDEILARRVQ